MGWTRKQLKNNHKMKPVNLQMTGLIYFRVWEQINHPSEAVFVGQGVRVGCGDTVDKDG